MAGPRKTPGRLALLAALPLRPARAQAVADSKLWLVPPGVVVAVLFLLFVLFLLYAVCCGEAGDSNKENEETARTEKEGEGDLGLELEEKEGPSNLEKMGTSSL
ncbi:small integral membrane protein 24 isoform X1 [Dasypus novemcinctus]|uniref:small integral membrane protein 24 isoform X1 n=1 Tax=Dasypus novemcinctus TaxID=9361 RepID=UPI0039C963B0